MKTLIIGLILIIPFSSCNVESRTGEPEVDNKCEINFEKKYSYIDSLDYVVLSHDTAWHWIFGKEFKKAELTKSEIIQVEDILSERVINYNSSLPSFVSKEHHVLGLRAYVRQYVPVVNKEGEKIVYINAFDSVKYKPYWKTELVGIMDGGNCCFQAKVNLADKKVIEFIVNGVA